MQTDIVPEGVDLLGDRAEFPGDQLLFFAAERRVHARDKRLETVAGIDLFLTARIGPSDSPLAILKTQTRGGRRG